MAGIVEALEGVTTELQAAGIERAVIDKTLVRTPCAWVALDSLGDVYLSGQRDAVALVYLIGDGADDTRRWKSLDDLLRKFDTSDLALTDEAIRVVGIDLPSGGTVPAFRVPIHITF